MTYQEKTTTVLGLDLGSNSLGWALLKFENKKPVAIINSGVRIFQAGLSGDIETGKAVSRATERREKRSVRRQIDRRKRRKQHLLHILQKKQLLPEGSPEIIFPVLDQKILDTYRAECQETLGKNLANVLPYWLRARALDVPLEPYELGRVIYHIAQRRGFLSNRKNKPDNDDGKVKNAISKLEEEMEAKGSRTLGEYLLHVDLENDRLRNRYTHRRMYEEEFDKICSCQKIFNENFTDEDIEEMKKTIFYQRPLKSSKKLVGYCDLEPNSRRAPWASMEAQDFRTIQMLNNCSIKTKDDLTFREFNEIERDKILKNLYLEGDLSFSKAKRLLGHTPKEVSFSLEEGGEKRFVGNRINKKLKEVFGEKWFSFDSVTKEQVISDLRSYRDSKALAERAKNYWKLDKDQVKLFVSIELEPGYCNLSRKAIKKLLPLMSKNLTYASAKKEVYGDILKQQHAGHMPFLPPVKSCFDVKNPVVERSMTELRKVVNSIIRENGKPDYIRIELARELKQSQKIRQEITNKNRRNERVREEIAKRLIEEVGIKNPTRTDILKIRLWDECNGICPYTSQPISMRDLFGENPRFDIEHIIPFSRSFDDSFANKTLCEVEENRSIKKNRSPWQVYHGTKKWDSIIGNVNRFKGSYKDAKLKRITLRPDEIDDMDSFISKQLNDTRYASKLAMSYLGNLYGGIINDIGRQKVFSVTGQITSILRNILKMNTILNDGGNKKIRNDHRHHAVDAVAIALTNPSMIEELSKNAYNSYKRSLYKKRFNSLQLPWPSFLEDLRKKVNEIVVSHRVDHKVNGALHEETQYGLIKGVKGEAFSVRRRLDLLSTKDVEKIIDPRIRGIVKEKLRLIEEKDPAKAFSDPSDHPYFFSKTGKKIWVHKVKIFVQAKPKNIGNKEKPKYFTTKANHHMEVFKVKSEHDSLPEKWNYEVVDTFKAMDRLRKGKPVICREPGDGSQFIFSISPGDTIRLGNPGEWPELLHIRTVSQSSNGSLEIAGVNINDARKKNIIQKSKNFYRIRSLSKFQSLVPQKVIVMPDGSIVECNE